MSTFYKIAVAAVNGWRNDNGALTWAAGDVGAWPDWESLPTALYVPEGGW